MPLPIPNTSSTDSFVRFGNGLYVNGWIAVQNQTGVTGGGGVQAFLTHKPGGGSSPEEQMATVTLTPGMYPLIGDPLDPITSINIKSAIAGTPAQFYGLLVEMQRAGFGAGSQLLGSISATGAVVTGTSSMITGIIPAAGAVATAGTGFSYTHVNGSGVYVFTFTTAFSAAPTVTVFPEPAFPGVGVLGWISAKTGAGFTVNWSGPTDVGFDFIATATA